MTRRVYVITISLIIVILVCGLFSLLTASLTPYRLREAIRTNDFKTFSRLISPYRANEPHRLSLDITLYLIHFACEESRVEMVRLLLDQGADIRALDSHGKTCVFHVVGGSRVEDAVAVLGILHAKDSTILDDREPVHGDTVLHYAVRIGCDAPIVAELLHLGAKLDTLNADGKIPRDLYRADRDSKEVEKLLQTDAVRN